MSTKNHQGSGTQPLSPDRNSKRSKRRKKRGFKSLEVSSRKHRRAPKRMYKSTDASQKSKGRINYH